MTHGRKFHHDAIIVDGLQINNWSRAVLQELISGGVTAVNATVSVWGGHRGEHPCDRRMEPVRRPKQRYRDVGAFEPGYSEGED